jgi:hypothetical protein
MTDFPFCVPLPPSWPKHAKAATLHIISLAHFVLTDVRGWAADSPIHRVRLTGEHARATIGARLDLVATPFRGARHLAQVEIRRAD